MTPEIEEADHLLAEIITRKSRRAFSPRLLLMARAYQQMRAQRDALAKVWDQAHQDMQQPHKVACESLARLPKEIG